MGPWSTLGDRRRRSPHRRRHRHRAPRRHRSGNGYGGSDGSGPGRGDPTRPTAGAAPAPRSKRNAKRAVVEWGILIVAALVIALVIKTFLFQAFYIPSESMVPTLEVGDRVLVNKLSYDLHDVHRGDIVVFAAEPNRGVAPRRHQGPREARRSGSPARPSPQCETDRICINGQLLDETYLPTGTVTTMPTSCRTSRRHRQEGARVRRPTAPRAAARCPPGTYFVMGDNRTDSKDAPCLRADQGVEHRRPRLPAHLAPRPPRLPVASRPRRRRRGSVAARIRRRSRPCGRRGRSRPRRCPWPASSRMWRTSCASHANASTLEPVEERDEARGPLGVVQVHASMPASAEVGRVALQRHRRPLRRRSSARASRRAPRRRASRAAPSFDEQSQSRSRAPSAAAATSTIGAAPRRGLRRRSRARSRRRSSRVEVGEAGHVELGELGGGRLRPPACAARPRRTTSSWTSTTSPSADSQASVSRPARAPLERPAERRERVLGHVGPGAPVGERDRGRHARLLPTSHPARAILKCPRPHADGCWQVGHECSWEVGPHDDHPSQMPGCGDVQLQIDDLTVRVCATTTSRARTASGARPARRRCPATASRAHRRPARLVRRAAGGLALPAELAEPHAGPPLTPDDLLDFHLMLEDDGWFDELVAMVRRTTPE